MNKILFALIFCSGTMLAQTVNYDQIVAPKYDGSLPMEEKLVYLAWQNSPAFRILDNNVLIAQILLHEAEAKITGKTTSTGEAATADKPPVQTPGSEGTSPQPK